MDFTENFGDKSLKLYLKANCILRQSLEIVEIITNCSSTLYPTCNE